MTPFQRLGFRLGLVIVVVVLAEAALLFSLPNSLFRLGEPQSGMPSAAQLRDDTTFGRAARSVLDDDGLSADIKEASLSSLVSQHLNSDDPELIRAVSRLTAAIYKPRAATTPLFLTILVALPALSLAALLSWWIARPVTAVVRTVGRLTDGDLGARVPVPEGLLHRGGELSLLARQFNMMADSLEGYERERRRLVADIAHELRTPIAVLQAQLDTLIDGVRPITREALLSLNEETELLTRLVDDLRLLSLAEGGRLALEKRTTDLKAFLAAVHRAFEPRAAEKGVKLTLSLPPTSVSARVDPNRFRQVLGNLLENALNHTSEGGRIELKLEQHFEVSSITLADSGPGIREEDLPYVFDRFYRAEKSRIRHSEGSGLGLTIVKALVELHGGQVTVRNRSEGGAVLTVSLPKA